MKRGISVIAFTAIAVCALSLAAWSVDKAKEAKKERKDNLYAQVELFSDAISLIRSDYVDEVESKKLIYGAMRGMLAGLDDFSQFMTPEEYDEIKLETKGEFGGLGIEIGLRDGILTIITPIPGTPAEEAGLKPQDKIVKIDDVVTKDITLTDAVKKMRGEPGTSVKLTIWREKDEKVFDVPMKRKIITIHSVKKAAILEDKIGYIKLVEFQENTPADLEAALKKLEAGGMDSLILDLRNNPGGLLDVAIEVSEKFLAKDKVIVSIKARNAEQNMEFKSSGRFNHPDLPMVVLVNEGSASASEILAGAIQDNRRGIVMGKKTFGKASVQTVIPMKDGSALRLTTASYLTPSGKIIKYHGIIPDIVAEETEPAAGRKEDKSIIFEKLEEKPVVEDKEAKKPEGEVDAQLERALDLMKAIRAYKTAGGEAKKS